MKKESVMKVVNLAIRIALFFLLDEILGIGIKVVEGILRGEHKAPSFVTEQLAVYSVIMTILMIIAYLILGNCIPAKSRIVKGLLFVFFFWIADYLPQILGMSGGYSPIISPDAMSFRTILIDSIGYIKTGLLLGAILAVESHQEKKDCRRKRFFLAIIYSMIFFPAIMFVLEMLIGFMNPEMTCVASFGISSEETICFYIVFYLFQAVSGIFFVLFYRYTEYNTELKHRWLIFATVHGWMLWTPVVGIMPFFGVAVAPTIVFALIMLVALYADTYIFAKVIE